MSEPYVPPFHFAVSNMSSLPDRDVAYWTEACRLQLVNHVCPVWGLPAPGAALYPKGTAFPNHTALAAVFVDDIPEPGVLGEHGVVAGLPYVLIDAHDSQEPGQVLSHEFIETTVNMDLDRWSEAGAYAYALEPADPVQAQWYEVTVDILGEQRRVPVSNFVFPAWYTPGTGADWFDYLSTLRAPLEIAEGGYAPAEKDGRIVYMATGSMKFGWRMFQPWSRPARLVAAAKKRRAP